jgi:hypothetical protein
LRKKRIGEGAQKNRDIRVIQKLFEFLALDNRNALTIGVVMNAGSPVAMNIPNLKGPGRPFRFIFEGAVQDALVLPSKRNYKNKT